MAFDYRFDPDGEYWHGPGTRPAHDWLTDLRRYQDVCGFGQVPPKTHEPFGPLAQWVQRMRRCADSGSLPFDVAANLALLGVPIELDRTAQKRASAQEGIAFERNLAQLQDWIRAEVTPVADLTYLDSRDDDMARRCYTFLEHMRLKLRQGVLPPDHLQTLQRVAIRVNGVALKKWLVPHGSLRDVAKMDTQDEARCRLGWSAMTEDALAAWCGRAIRGKWQLGVYLPGRGVRAFEVGTVASARAYSIPGEPSGTLMLCDSPASDERKLVFRMRQPEERSTLPTVRAAQYPVRSGPDTGPGKPLGTGARYGALTILGRVMRPSGEKRSGHFYRCRCDCGEVVVRQRDTIVTRDYATCGCGIQRNLAGMEFGHLTVLNEYRRIGSGRNTEWKVTCSCGNQTWVRAAALKSGKTRSCGCLRGQARAA